MLVENEGILITVVGGVLLVLFLVAVFILSIVRFQKRIASDLMEKQILKERYEQEILQSKLETQEQTFQHIGKELHDNIGQLLSTSRMLLGLTERNLEHPPETLLDANETIGQAISELRSLSKSLDKEWLEQFNLYENLLKEIERMNNATDIIRAEFICNADIFLVPDQQIILFRIIQECIQNAIKHGHPDHINILITQHSKELVITVSDNGAGFDIHQSSAGLGFRNMKHRTTLLNGSILWESVIGHGTTVCITIPLQNPDLCE